MPLQKEKLLSSLKEKGFSEDILRAFEKVRREDFVPEQVINYAYDDIALPLSDGSTLSQPSTITFMLSLLEPKQGQKILEIGSGSGYALSLISEMIKSGKIFGLEINQNLAINSKKLLQRDSNINIINRSGLSGLPEEAPFDRILVSAAFSDKKIPLSLIRQLKNDGILVAPVNGSIIKIKKEDGKTQENEFQGFQFVPFVEK